MQANYRAIFTEMLNAQAAAVAAFADVGIRCAELVGQQCQAALATPVKPSLPDGAGAGPTQPDRGSGGARMSPSPLAGFCRAVAGLPRFSMMSFLSHFDDLRGPRRAVRD
jgi:hypothetical protein